MSYSYPVIDIMSKHADDFLHNQYPSILKGHKMFRKPVSLNGKARRRMYVVGICICSLFTINAYATTIDDAVVDYQNQNYKSALNKFSQLADKGNDTAQYYLGQMYVDEQVAKPNYTLAAQCFKKAAESGIPEAQYSMGIIYTNGDGVTKNDSSALNWFLKAAEKDYTPAQTAIGSMYMTGKGIQKNHAEAVQWLIKAADKGVAIAQFNLAIEYLNGLGVAQDSLKAIQLFKKAAEQGYAEAQYNLGVMYNKGQSVVQDYHTAFQWYKKAADQGLALAQYNLGILYENGKGVARNHDSSALWLSKAAEQGITNTVQESPAAPDSPQPQKEKTSPWFWISCLIWIVLFSIFFKPLKKFYGRFGNLFSFDGRIRRKQYTIGFCVGFAAFFVLLYLESFLNHSNAIYKNIDYLIGWPITLTFFWFYSALKAKRCHDCGNSGWWQLVPCIGWFLFFANSNKGNNKYGPNPKEEPSAASIA